MLYTYCVNAFWCTISHFLKSLNSEQFYIKKELNSKISNKQLLKPSKVVLYVDTCGLQIDPYVY